MKLLNHVKAFSHAPYHVTVAAGLFLLALWAFIYYQYDNDTKPTKKVEPKPSKAKKGSRKAKRK